MRGVERLSLLALVVASVGCSPFGGSDRDTPDPADNTADAAHAGDAGAAADGAVARPADSPSGAIVFDSFSREIAAGLGQAEVGGKWSGSAGDKKVAEGAARFTVDLATTAWASAAEALVSNVDLEAVLSSDNVGETDASLGRGLFLSLRARDAQQRAYYVKVVITKGGLVSTAVAMQGLTHRELGSRVGSLMTVVAGEKIRVRFQVFGSQPTTVRAKVWKAALAEPELWTVEGSDNTLEVPHQGATGLQADLSSEASGPITLSLDTFSVRALASLTP